MKNKLLIVFTLGVLLIQTGCFSKKAEEKSKVKFAVISDIHYYDSALGTTGAAFEAYLAADRKLIKESGEILNSAITSIKSEKPDFVLIPGDLTKDGEKQNHLILAEKLKELEKSGIKVFIINGNHDVNNYDSVSYPSDGTTPTAIAKVSADEFKSNYAEFGYNESFSKDSVSLSYAVEPEDGIWIIAIDSCRYDENTEENGSVTAGKIRVETLEWIRALLKEAKLKNKMVLGMMHHGIIEHFKGQSQFFSEYVVSDWDSISTEFANLGMKFVFTGHYHAQDIVKKTTDTGNNIYDIETGSLVTYPNPYRIIELESNNKMVITSSKVETINNVNLGGKTFQNYSKDYITDGLTNLAPHMLMSAPYNVTQSQAQQLSPLMVSSMIAHYAGDETADSTTISIISSMTNSEDSMTKVFGGLLQSLWTDSEPKDNNIVIE